MTDESTDILIALCDADPVPKGIERLRRDLGIAQRDSFEADERRMVLSRADRFEME